MEVKEKIQELRKDIDKRILPLITNDYVLWGLPYYFNPGDTLIWEGALDMLDKCRHNCLGTCGWNEYKYVPLKQETVILIIGGGFFGDVWRDAWDNVMNTIVKYPENPIVILPQSIYYQDEQCALDDAEKLSQLKRLTICVRDKSSFDFAIRTFSNKCILAPDLAFHANLTKLELFRNKESGKSLYLKRNDKELPYDVKDVQVSNIDIKDWPIMSGHFSTKLKVVNTAVKWAQQFNLKGIEIWLLKYGNRNAILYDAVKFLSPYHTIYTTRLHVMILSFMLGKRVYILDNSYGKVSGCFSTWLSDCKNVTIYE